MSYLGYYGLVFNFFDLFCRLLWFVKVIMVFLLLVKFNRE